MSIIDDASYDLDTCTPSGGATTVYTITQTTDANGQMFDDENSDTYELFTDEFDGGVDDGRPTAIGMVL